MEILTLKLSNITIEERLRYGIFNHNVKLDFVGHSKRDNKKITYEAFLLFSDDNEEQNYAVTDKIPSDNNGQEDDAIYIGIYEKLSDIAKYNLILEKSDNFLFQVFIEKEKENKFKVIGYRFIKDFVNFKEGIIIW